MPKLWDDTIEAHRLAVREAALDVTAALVAADGLRAVTMSRVAEETGIGRATLYKYFPDVQTILVAWHERQISRHLSQLEKLHGRGGGMGERLEQVLEAYALIQHEQPSGAVAAGLHHGPHVAQAQRQLHVFIATLLAEGVESGQIRRDVSPDELAGFCLHALGAAESLPSKAAVRRLVGVTLAGLQGSQ